MKKTAVKYVTGLMVLALAFFAGLFLSEKVQAAEQKIEKGVRIGSIDAGGMTKDEAVDAVKKLEKDLKAVTFTLKTDKGSMKLSAKEMGVKLDAEKAAGEALQTGISGTLIDRFKQEKNLEKQGKDIKIGITLNRQKTAEKIYENRSDLGTEAENNRVIRENGSFTYVEGKSGVEVDVVQSVYAIEDRLKEWESGASKEIELVTKTAKPKGSREELEQIKDVLGEFSTDYSSSSSQRAQNVENGVSKINQTILYPGDEFSVYDTVSPFSKENGYELAGSYANGTTVESFGGGICQVSTTLYNAVIRAELQVLKRFNHSMAVAYVKPSEDAAIAGTYKDMRFRNNLNHPVYIQGYCEAGRVHFIVYGKEERPSNREISFESEVIKTIEPETKYEYTNAYDAGVVETKQGSHTGYVAQLWKIVTVDGKEESKEIFNKSTYDASPRIITVGTGGASKEQLAAIKDAAKGDDISDIQKAAEKSKDDKKKEEKKKEDKKKKDEDDSSKKEKSDTGQKKNTDDSNAASDENKNQKSEGDSTSSKGTSGEEE